MKYFFTVALISFSFAALSAQHFTETYQTEQGWRVDHFAADSGELQDLVESKYFSYLHEAKQYAHLIKQNYPLQKSFSLVTTEPGVVPLWKVTQTWSPAWEQAYGEWVAKEFDQDMFVRTGLATDCADVAYALRWIFARNNGLPAAATLSGSGVVVSHLSAKKEWNQLPGHELWFKDKRFLAALNWLLDAVYTGTLYKDTYPVLLTRETVRPGLINLLGGHTEVFNHVSYVKGEIPLQVLSSTVPKAIRVLSPRVFMDSEVTQANEGGLVQFRWPVLLAGKWSLVPKTKMLNYSLDQYKPDLCEDEQNFTLCLFKKLDMDFDGEAITKKLITDLENTMKSRVQIVEDGFTYCQSNNCAPGSEGYENWGTPSRDKRLAKAFTDTEEMASDFHHEDDFSKWLEESVIKVPFEMSVQDFSNRLKLGFVSYDPRASVEERWAKDEKAVTAHVQRRLAENETIRMSLIDQAATCRLDVKKCQEDRSLFDRLSSAEIDLQSRTLFSSWLSYRAAEGASIEVADQKMMSQLWQSSPAPWDSVSERLGEHRSTDAHFLEAQSVNEASSGKIILNQKKIYDVNSRSVMEMDADEVFFDPSVRRYLVRLDDKLMVLGEDFSTIGNHSLINKFQDFLGVHFFGQGQVLISEGNQKAWLLDLKNNVRGESFQYSEIHEEKTHPEAVLLVSLKMTSMVLVGDKVSVQTFPSLSQEITDAVHLRDHNYLLALSSDEEESTEAGFWGKDGFKKIIEESEEELSLGRLNSSFVYMTANNKTHLVNAKDFTVEEIELGDKVVVSKDKTIVVTDSEDVKVLLFNGASKKELPFHSENELGQLLSATEDWISFNTGNVFDYSGNLLSSSNTFMTGICQESVFEDFCSSQKADLLIDYHMRRHVPESYYKYSRFGFGRNRKITDVLGYNITLWNDDFDMFEIDGESEERFEVTSGSGVKVSSKHILWYP